ncbi:FMN-binding negative transcriptional regulator [Chlorogloeopsis fritschii]|uniref:FMN-binding negative transcriptional regulator n=1 Tax=Chlorogloeopsis fritschii TaxID=1124 RepID=UPI0023F75FEF|nr:FMN-binding negative transcriptional regulator [Chlorogloeopsis fritschii]
MYIPNAFREEDTEKLVAFMRANSFATLVSVHNHLPIASHIPLVVTVQNNIVKLTGHLAKANPHWQVFGESESLAIFTGPHAYISPSLCKLPSANRFAIWRGLYPSSSLRASQAIPGISGHITDAPKAAIFSAAL